MATGKATAAAASTWSSLMASPSLTPMEGRDGALSTSFTHLVCFTDSQLFTFLPHFNVVFLHSLTGITRAPLLALLTQGTVREK